MLIEELYDALIEAGATEAKAKAAARASIGSLQNWAPTSIRDLANSIPTSTGNLQSSVSMSIDDLQSSGRMLKEFTDIRGSLKLHNWMLATNIALLTAILLKMFS